MLDILRKPPFNIPQKAIFFGTQLENATIFNFVLNRLDQGHTLEKALDAAEDVFFTFTHLTEFERNFMRQHHDDDSYRKRKKRSMLGELFDF